MPPPSRRTAPAVRQLVIVDAAHAARAFPERELARIAVEQEIARTGGAVLVLARGPIVERVLPLANGAEIASATGTIAGAVAFQIEALDTLPPPSIPEPLSRDLHAAALDVEAERLRRVEVAARDLLASLPRCGHHQSAPATRAFHDEPLIAVYCDTCGTDPKGDRAWLCDAPGAASVRALASLLTDAGELAS
jgi:hypothetical protein